MIVRGLLRHCVIGISIGGWPVSTPANWLSAYVTTFSGPDWKSFSSSDGSSVAMWSGRDLARRVVRTREAGVDPLDPHDGAAQVAADEGVRRPVDGALARLVHDRHPDQVRPRVQVLER